MATVSRSELTTYLNTLLKPEAFEDYCPNGLQIEGKDTINKIAFAVSATADSVEKAIKEGVDALIVHHGLFWKFHGTKTITGPFAKRVKPLIENNINLFAYHLPLDGNLEMGNAASLAKLLGMINIQHFCEGKMKGSYMGVKGEFTTTAQGLSQALEKILNHPILLSTPNPEKVINSIGIITGGANSQWASALASGLDAYITGEMSEHDWHEARESDMVMLAGGHHATEQFGIQALMKIIEEKFKISGVYIDSENPA
ncbi:MAG: Nif3-like dinuclear metal center hexameric protein [Legionellales bacterium]|jgi:dinuclear metal center YbgI/SA1388 family protein